MICQEASTKSGVRTEALRIRIGVGKAKREDLVALHSQISEALRALKSQGVRPTYNIFKSVPTIITFYKDLARAREDLDRGGRH